MMECLPSWKRTMRSSVKKNCEKVDRKRVAVESIGTVGRIVFRYMFLY